MFGFIKLICSIFILHSISIYYNHFNRYSLNNYRVKIILYSVIPHILKYITITYNISIRLYTLSTIYF